ncbi:4-hydroxythreonine-4-phosphate dehydrogenase PdxA [Melioribacteraceae bacterium 4301-Me]|uniref:4-hydroxythreonine-4-phosphate dehydrogenase PdxA n=1 Tax=Pyranulibacter aquaticus TaxID=3163344 RepID=UPI003598783F
MGDPAGIGPEITVKAFSHKSIHKICKPIVIGDSSVLANAVSFLKSKVKINSIKSVDDAKFSFGTMNVYDLNNVDVKKLKLGKVSAMAGNAAFESVKTAIQLALDKKIDAVVTGPIHKEALNLAGHNFSGHTEIFGYYTKTKNYAMLLVEGNMRVIHVTTHISLRSACDLIKKKRVFEVIKLADEACRKLGIKSPRIGVAGLNPHASDGGLFGWEEQKEIIPAVKAAKKIGINVEGPFAGDTIFPKLKGGSYDIVVAMYHDQGHIPLKLLGFSWNEKKQKWDSVSGVNITVGLPIIRVSVDHGTAFDQAGKGTATEESLLNAISYAAAMAKNSN